MAYNPITAVFAGFNVPIISDYRKVFQIFKTPENLYVFNNWLDKGNGKYEYKLYEMGFCGY